MVAGKPLTALSIKKALTDCKGTEKPFKLSDTGGLYLLIKPSIATGYWRLKYRHLGKEKALALGIYPETSLQEARDCRDEAKKLIRNGIDPAALKKEEKRQNELKSANTFEAVAREWLDIQRERWSENHGHRITTSLERDVFPHLGTRPVEKITTLDVIDVLRRVEKRDALDVAKRTKQRIASVFAFAKQTGRATHNPATDLKGVLKTRKQVHHPALQKTEMPTFMKKLAKYDGEDITRLALHFVILTFVRSTEAREAKWTEFNFRDKEWRIPNERMKMREEHIVPLSKQALKVLAEIKKITGNDEYVFQAKFGGKPISENTMIYALYRMGYHKRATVHGFRATASTILNESGKFNPDAIERQLAHAERDEVRAAYNRSQYLPERIRLMQWWGDYLDTTF